MAQDIKAHSDKAMSYLESYGEIDEIAEGIIKMINAADVLQNHLELCSKIFETNSQEEVEEIKEKFSIIKHFYEKVKIKEDFTPITAKYAVVIFHDKIFLEFQKALKKCFKINKYGEAEIIKSLDNFDHIKIVVSFLFKLNDFSFIRLNLGKI